MLHSSLLRGWIHDSMERVRRAAPGDKNQADIKPLLPNTAGDFFHFYSTAAPSDTSKLQRSLSAKANSFNMQAAVESLKRQSRLGEKRQWAHHRAITAKGAWGWKLVMPEGPHLRLSDVEYAVAARLNLGLRPFPARAMAAPARSARIVTRGRLCPCATTHGTRSPVPTSSRAS